MLNFEYFIVESRRCRDGCFNRFLGFVWNDRRLGWGIAVFLLCAAVMLCGCQESPVAAPTVQPMTGRVGSFADYVRNEPAVRDVQVWDNPYGDGLAIDTKHYRIFTTLLEPLMLRQVPAYMEAAFGAYQSQLPSAIETTRQFEVYLFATRDQWERFTRDFVGDDAELYLKIQKGAYTAKGVCVAYNIGRKQTFSVMGHEGWHQFNQHLFAYRLPSWLDEGIATLFETCRYDKGRFVFEPGQNWMRLGALKQTMVRGQMIPLRQLIALNPGQVVGHNGTDDAVIAFYAQNYALVRFLREHNYGIRLARYHALMLGGAAGTWPLKDEYTALAADRTRALTVGWNMTVAPTLFAYYIDPDIERLEAEYRTFCRKITHRVSFK